MKILFNSNHRILFKSEDKIFFIKDDVLYWSYITNFDQYTRISTPNVSNFPIIYHFKVNNRSFPVYYEYNNKIVYYDDQYEIYQSGELMSEKDYTQVNIKKLMELL